MTKQEWKELAEAQRQLIQDLHMDIRAIRMALMDNANGWAQHQLGTTQKRIDEHNFNYHYEEQLRA